jgi:hypothetical protein
LSEKNRKQSFIGFLKDLQKKQPIEPVFIRHFGYSFDQLAENWQAWIKSKGSGRHFPPSIAIQQQVFEAVIPLIMDHQAPIMVRVQSIRDMGNAGYVVGADSLIALLQDPDPRIRTVSLWALQNISGLGIGDDVSRWSSWWDHLPADALSAPNSLVLDSTQEAGT